MLSQDDVQNLATAIRRIAFGDTSGPTGLERVSMSLDKIAESLEDLAEAVRESKA